MPDVPELAVLLPPGLPPVRPDDDDRLSELYAEPRLPWLRATMIATLDGSATGPDARSGSVNGPADHRVFDVLRARADVVLVGAGTARAERYGAVRTPEALAAGRRRRGQAPHPPIAVVTRSGEVPEPLLADEPAPFVVTGRDAPGLARLRRRVPGERLLVHDGAVDLGATLTALAEAGLPRVLAEGGPGLLRDLLGAGLVDELCLTWSPVLVGGPGPRVLADGGWLTPPRTARLGHLLHDDGVLLGRWFLHGASDAAPADTLSP